MRLNQRDALTAAINSVGIPNLAAKLPYGYRREDLVSEYEEIVCTEALRKLGYSKTVAERNAKLSTGCARIRLDKALRRLFYEGK